MDIELHCPEFPASFTPGSEECGACPIRKKCAALNVAIKMRTMVRHDLDVEMLHQIAFMKQNVTPRSRMFSMRYLKSEINMAHSVGSTTLVAVCKVSVERAVSDLLLVDEMMRRGELTGVGDD